ncbi:MAG: FAD-dependent oxidoreductase, partial [Solirubrobacteraceae bacterium]
MTCDACARHVRDALQGAGAQHVDVDWRTGRALVVPNGASARELSAALHATKYQVTRVLEPGARSARQPDGFEYDLAILGSGGGAFSAAIAACRADLRVVMIERGTVGGTCVNVGCIPSKALLAAAENRHRADGSRFPGISTTAGPVDFAGMIRQGR